MFVDFLLPLSHLSERWNSAPRDWSLHETLDKIEFVADQFNREEALRLDLELLQELSGTFQEALEFSIQVGDHDVFRLHSNINGVDLDNFRRESEGAATVHINFCIRKSRLAELCYAGLFSFIEGNKLFFLYFYEAKLSTYLKNCNLENIESDIWKNKKDATVVVVLPHDNVCLAGQRLLICGGEYLDQASLQKIEWHEDQYVDQAYSVSRENLKWHDVRLNFITPWHLFVQDQEKKSSADIKATLAAHFLNTFLLYSADFSFLQKKDSKDILISRYTTQNRNLEIAHQNSGISIEGSEKQKELLSILNWIYDPQWSAGDRLTLAQQNIVDTINNFKEVDRFQALLDKAGTIKKNIDWHWETFTHKKIDAYFGVIKDYEDYLNQIAQGFATDIANILKSLSETLIAAIAVVIGSFIASLFKDTFNPFIFHVGLIAYAVYVLGVPLLYNMILRWKEYQSYQAQRDARIKRLRESLPDTKIQEIWDSWKIDTISTRFKWVFWITVVIYIVVIILLLLAAWLVPPGVIANVIHLAPPTVTPAVPPTLTPATTQTVVPTNTPSIVPTISITRTVGP
jgi:hypothetical protein